MILKRFEFCTHLRVRANLKLDLWESGLKFEPLCKLHYIFIPWIPRGYFSLLHSRKPIYRIIKHSYGRI